MSAGDMPLAGGGGAVARSAVGSGHDRGLTPEVAVVCRFVHSCLNQRVAGPIDLHHQTDRVVGVYLVETEAGPALFDCGPSTCIGALKAGLAELGLALTDVRHLLLSHIHLDHAGAAGTLVREHPALQVHVSEVGATHIVDPSRLEGSARRLYGDAFDELWGELAPVPDENVRVVGERVLGLECFPSPGHASHHVCYLHADGTLYAGDAAGVRIVPARHVLPVSPPPDVDVEAWFRTFEEIERRRPERLALIHFGVVDSPSEHLALVREELARWSEWCEHGLDEEAWIEAARTNLMTAVGDEADLFERAAPLWQSYVGMKRYWEKRREAAERVGAG
jgi:glyoxylase-like metal-dependent hydrolase (beta-lactamase superfamily II)